MNELFPLYNLQILQMSFFHSMMSQDVDSDPAKFFLFSNDAINSCSPFEVTICLFRLNMGMKVESDLVKHSSLDNASGDVFNINIIISEQR